MLVQSKIFVDEKMRSYIIYRALKRNNFGSLFGKHNRSYINSLLKIFERKVNENNKNVL